MKIDIPDEKFREVAEKAILRNLKENALDQLQYWVRSEVYKILSTEVVKRLVDKHFSADEIKKLAKESMKEVLEEKFNTD